MVDPVARRGSWFFPGNLKWANFVWKVLIHPNKTSFMFGVLFLKGVHRIWWHFSCLADNWTHFADALHKLQLITSLELKCVLIDPLLPDWEQVSHCNRTEYKVTSLLERLTIVCMTFINAILTLQFWALIIILQQHEIIPAFELPIPSMTSEENSHHVTMRTSTLRKNLMRSFADIDPFCPYSAERLARGNNVKISGLLCTPVCNWGPQWSGSTNH